MKRTLLHSLTPELQDEVTIQGVVEASRRVGAISFLVVRDYSGTAQVVLDGQQAADTPPKHSFVSINGTVRSEAKAQGGLEIAAQNVNILARPPAEGLPIPITARAQVTLAQQLAHRGVHLRNPKAAEIFSLQSAIAGGFRDYLTESGFTEIFTPKIVPGVAESGATAFQLDYFGNQAALAQSPQFYKQMMVGTPLERVFEIGPVFRAEHHDTTRHLNTYTSMDLEMAYIQSHEDLMDLEEDLMSYIFTRVQETHGKRIKEQFGVELPKVPDRIPRVRLAEMKDIMEKRFRKNRDAGKDIDPEGERLASKHILDQTGSEWVFLTHYPTHVRPFYTMRDSENPEETRSFDLILRGLEVTTGGQRINGYAQLLASMNEFGVDSSINEGYLESFKVGMPPHGGLGIGLERLTMKALNLQNVREATLFPRDRTRYSP